MLKRLFDFTFSFLGLLILFPVLLLIAILIKLSTKGPIFYKQLRVGRNNKDFKIFKFRTMKLNSDRQGLLTVGGKDSRITSVGYYLRKYKLDELPQLINVFIGNMSFVGPRPEVRKYVNFYSSEQLNVLSIKPGITDIASIKFRDESEILSKQENPEKYYIEIIMPYKIKLNLEYIQNRNILKDIGVIFKTFKILV